MSKDQDVKPVDMMTNAAVHASDKEASRYQQLLDDYACILAARRGAQVADVEDIKEAARQLARLPK